MPFKSKAQEKAAFGGYLGKEMKDDAKEWASKTDQKKIPEHVHDKKESVAKKMKYVKSKSLSGFPKYTRINNYQDK